MSFSVTTSIEQSRELNPYCLLLAVYGKLVPTRVKKFVNEWKILTELEMKLYENEEKIFIKKLKTVD